MAWYPGAIKMELQPESDAQAEIRPTQLIVHSLAAPWTARRTYEFWRDSTNLESHFAIGYAGDIAQFIGTHTRADANASANRRPDGTGAISAETASNLHATDPWTDEQIEELIQLGVWAHQEEGIPLRICRTPDDPGFGWHAQFTAWNPDAHACPGPDRIRQFREVVFPAIVARSTPPPTEEDPVPHTLGRYDTTDRTITPRKWTALTIENVDLLTDATAYQASAHLTTTLPAGATLQGRFYHYRPDGTRWTGPLTERGATAGQTFADYTNSGSIAATEKLRFEVAYYPALDADDAPITITTAQLRGLYWK